MIAWLFRLICGLLIVGAVAVGGMAHAAEAPSYGVGPHLCGSFGNVMAKVALFQELQAPYEDVLAGRQAGVKACREAGIQGCPSDVFITAKVKEAWGMSKAGHPAAEVGQYFYDECLKANGVEAEEPNLGKRLH